LFKFGYLVTEVDFEWTVIDLDNAIQRSGSVGDIDIVFSDTACQIRLRNCEPLLTTITEICHGWPYEIFANGFPSSQPFLLLERSADRYHLSSDELDKTKSFTDPVDAVCSMIVELAWASLRNNPDWLCIHCAAVEIAGRLVVFPNARRAGKSTISTLLGLKGYKVFTDDFLAVEVSQQNVIHGISSGISTRMRKPWPSSFSTSNISRLNQSMNVTSKQYSYHNKNNNMPIPRGARCPIGAIVLLERNDDIALEIAPAKLEKTLRTIILQNFARANNSANILEVLYCLVSQVSCYELKYSNAEDAILLLESEFKRWEKEEPRVLSNQFNSREAPNLDGPSYEVLAAVNKSHYFHKNSDVVEYSVGEIRFLATPNGKSIFQLDEISTSVWNALSKPIRPNDIIELFCYAFPDQERSTIETDIGKLLQKFANNEMIVEECHAEK
jgi:hypothetical protein